MTKTSEQHVNDTFAGMAWYIKRVLGTADLYEGFTATPEELREKLGAIRGDLARVLTALNQLLDAGFFSEEQYAGLVERVDAIFSMSYPDKGPDADFFIPLFNAAKRLQAETDRYKFVP